MNDAPELVCDDGTFEVDEDSQSSLTKCRASDAEDGVLESLISAHHGAVSLSHHIPGLWIKDESGGVVQCRGSVDAINSALSSLIS